MLKVTVEQIADPAADPPVEGKELFAFEVAGAAIAMVPTSGQLQMFSNLPPSVLCHATEMLKLQYVIKPEMAPRPEAPGIMPVHMPPNGGIDQLTKGVPKKLRFRPGK
jgi:hypothetical protein